MGLAQMPAHPPKESDLSKEMDSCPFCSSSNVSLEQFRASRRLEHNVHCNECQADGPVADTPEEAVELWNTRHDKKQRGDGHDRGHG